MKFLYSICFFLLSFSLSAQQFSPLGYGLDGNAWNQIGITSLCEFNGNLVASGYFTKSNNTALQHIAVWDGNNWADVGCSSGVVSPAEAMCVYNNELYIGGIFDVCEIDTNIGATKTYIARWDGINWKPVGLKPFDNCSLINCMFVYKNELYVGGSFTKIGGISAKNIAKWNGHSWSNLESGLSGGLFGVQTMEVFNGDLYVGGDFKFSGNMNARYLAKWNGTNWDSLEFTPNSIVKSLKADSVNNKLYVSGNFTKIGGLTSYGISSWDGNLWESLAPVDTMYYTVDLEIFNNMLYVTSTSPTVLHTGDTLNYFYKYDINNSKWTKIINEFNNTPSTVMKFKDNLVIGGYFDLPYKSVSYFKDYYLGIGVESKSKELAIYPNPTSRILNITGDKLISKLELFDTNRKMLFSNRINSNEYSISMQNYPIGVYYLKITFDDDSITTSIIRKEK